MPTSKSTARLTRSIDEPDPFDAWNASNRVANSTAVYPLVLTPVQCKPRFEPTRVNRDVPLTTTPGWVGRA